MTAQAGRIPDPLLDGGEEEFDRSLRPRRLAEFVGQEAVKEQLSIFMEAARARIRSASIWRRSRWSGRPPGPGC